MKSRIFFIIKYYFFWVAIFLLQKLMFMVFNFHDSMKLNFVDWLGVLWHGLRLDMSAAAYLMAIPVIFITLLCFFDPRYTRSFLKVYNYIFLFVVLYLGVVDMELYSYWGVKLDAAPLVYLKTPKEAALSTPVIEIVLLFVFLLALYIAGLKIYRKFVLSALEKSNTSFWPFSFVGIFTLGFLILPMRGGIGIAPINLGSAYFHANRFANHSAINVLWNSMYSLVERKSLNTSFRFMDEAKADELFSTFYPPEVNHTRVVKRDANVILVILESFSNKIIGELGGEKGITPFTDTLCRNSLVFPNFFATGDRSEKGMVGIFSGYPAQPTTSIIEFPSKTQSMPFLAAPFHDKGYYTAFYYGGDMNFANFRSYFTNQWMDRLITKNDFPSELSTQKWGVPDQFLFDKMIADIDTINSPFFISCFSLSSHEPYDTPMEPVFPTNNRNDMSKNGFYYTDRCLGKFIQQAKTKPWWENTLVIIIADHGSRFPGNTPNHVREKFNIPMIWTGGALETPATSIYTYSSQSDLPRTLLRQLDLPADNYKFSQDILDVNPKSFAMYFFNNGFGYMSDSVQGIYDNNINAFIDSTGTLGSETRESSKAYLQVLSRDFSSR